MQYFRPVLMLVASVSLVLWGCKVDETIIPNSPSRGKILYSEVQYNYTANQVDSILTALNPLIGQLITPTYDVRVVKVHYQTIDWNGAPTFASGLIIMPVTNDPITLPLLSYQHGTILKKSDVASQSPGGEQVVGLYCASDGYLTCMPDYLGLGDGPGFHPYMHAKTEATSVIDLLRAARNYAAAERLTLDGKLFLMGYSQGGHSTMAAAKELQTNYSGEFTITACAPMAGPYDVSGVQANVITSNTPYPTPGYLPYVLYSYNMVYKAYPDVRDVILDQWDSIIHPRMDGYTGMGALNNLCPAIPNAIMEPDILDDFRNNPNHIMRRLLKDNDLYNWTPRCPLRMYYCKGDDQVAYENSLVAYNSFIARGATQVEHFNVDDNLNHSDCALPSLINGKAYFDDFR